MKHSVPAQTENDLIDFYRNAIRTRSYSNQEGDIAVLILKEMEKLGYDECYIDRVGNVVGRVGSGKKIIHFDYTKEAQRPLPFLPRSDSSKPILPQCA